MERRLSVTNLSSENSLPMYRLNAPVVMKLKWAAITNTKICILEQTHNYITSRFYSSACIIHPYQVIWCANQRQLFVLRIPSPLALYPGRVSLLPHGLGTRLHHPLTHHTPSPITPLHPSHPLTHHTPSLLHRYWMTLVSLPFEPRSPRWSTMTPTTRREHST